MLHILHLNFSHCTFIDRVAYHKIPGSDWTRYSEITKPTTSVQLAVFRPSTTWRRCPEPTKQILPKYLIKISTRYKSLINHAGNNNSQTRNKNRHCANRWLNRKTEDLNTGWKSDSATISIVSGFAIVQTRRGGLKRKQELRVRCASDAAFFARARDVILSPWPATMTTPVRVMNRNRCYRSVLLCQTVISNVGACESASCRLRIRVW